MLDAIPGQIGKVNFCSAIGREHLQVHASNTVGNDIVMGKKMTARLQGER
jgi:hypothetical protein